jgi:hypothetical protein
MDRILCTPSQLSSSPASIGVSRAGKIFVKTGDSNEGAIHPLDLQTDSSIKRFEAP